MALSTSEVMAALSTIAGPDGRTPLAGSSAIAGLSVRDGRVYLAISIDAAQSMALEPMRAAAEAALKALPGATGALVTLTADAAPGGAPTRAPGPKAQAARSGQAIPGVRHIVAVASGKGGVGKSTTAANLALALAGEGLRVGILDADVYGPSMPRLFGLSQKPELVEGRMMRPLEAHGLKIMSIGFLVEEDTPMIWRGPMVMSALTQMLREVAWGELDLLIVDMPPGTGDAQLTLAQAVPLAGAVIVSTPQDLALIDARRGLAMFRRVEVPVLGIVENMSYFLCPHCGERSDIFAHGGARHEAQTLGVPFLGEVPLALAIRARSDAGMPIVVAEPDGVFTARYRDIARALVGQLALGPARAAPRVVIEGASSPS